MKHIYSKNESKYKKLIEYLNIICDCRLNYLDKGFK